jgi:uncharacterized protein
MIQADTENERLVIDFFEALSCNDLARGRALLHAASTWTVMSKSLPMAGVYEGRNRIIDDFLAPILCLFEDGEGRYKVIVNNLISKESQVAAETRVVGRFKTGKTYDNHYAWIFDVRDGLIFTIREYLESHTP